MAQQQIIDANLMYKIGKASKADPMAKVEAEKRRARRERIRGYLATAGQMAVNYWVQGQTYMRKLQEQTSPLTAALDITKRKAGIVNDLEMYNNIQEMSNQLYEYNKTMKKWRMLPGSDKYREAENGRVQIMQKIKALDVELQGAASYEEQLAQIWADDFGITKSQEGFGGLVGRTQGVEESQKQQPFGEGTYSHFQAGPVYSDVVGDGGIKVPSILSHNSSERVRNSAFFASGEWRKSSYLDKETGEIMLHTPQGDMRLKDFVSLLAVPGDSKINGTATSMIPKIVKGRATAGGDNYNVWENFYKSSIGDFMGNTQTMSENAYKSWFFTWKGISHKSKDGTTTYFTPAETGLNTYIDELGLGAVPGKVDDPTTPDVDESKMEFEYNGNTLTYLGALDKMKEMQYSSPNSRQDGIMLYTEEVKKHHENIEGQKTKITKEISKEIPKGTWFTPGTYINIGGTEKKDRRSISATKANVLTNQLIKKEGTITYEGITYGWHPEYNVFAGDDGSVYSSIDDFLNKISPSGALKNELIGKGAYEKIKWEGGDIEGFNKAFTTEDPDEGGEKKKKKRSSIFGNWMQNIGVIPGGYESKVR